MNKSNVIFVNKQTIKMIMYRRIFFLDGHRICYNVVMPSVTTPTRTNKNEWQLMFIKARQTKSCTFNNVMTIAKMHFFSWQFYAILFAWIGNHIPIMEVVEIRFCIDKTRRLLDVQHKLFDAFKQTHSFSDSTPSGFALRRNYCYKKLAK